MFKISLGTVQFGLDYGISNHSGKVQYKEVIEILREANTLGIGFLDTAAGYGNSEEILGNAIEETELSFQVVTKIPPIKAREHVREFFEQSLSRLKISKINGCMFHSFSTIQNVDGSWNELVQLKNQGYTDKIGVSLYHPWEFDWMEDCGFIPDIVQVPYNVFDQRFEDSLEKMKGYGVEIHVRSVFLQGLFFIKPQELHEFFAPLKEKVLQLRLLASELNVSLEAILLHFVLMNSNIDHIVIGVTEKKQLIENVRAANIAESLSDLTNQMKNFQVHDENMILPFNWKTNE